MPLTIKPMQPQHWPSVQTIFKQGIATKQATFETQAPNWETWHQDHRADCRLVACLDEDVVGWAALSPVSGRCVYGGVAEVSIYIAKTHRKQGIGTALLQTLIQHAETAGLWTLQAGIFPENKGSIALHKQCGFREIGFHEKLGQLNGVWRDVILLERRSKIVGV